MVIRVSIRTLGLQESVLYYRRIKRGMNRALDRGLKRSSNLLASEMQRQAPVATGELRNKIEVRKATKFSYTVGSRARHTKFVEKGRTPGSRPPPLRGRRFRQWLTLKGIPKRKWYAVARSIGRKGIVARPFQQRAFEVVQRQMFRELIRDFRKLLRRTSGR